MFQSFRAWIVCFTKFRFSRIDQRDKIIWNVSKFPGLVGFNRKTSTRHNSICFVTINHSLNSLLRKTWTFHKPNRCMKLLVVIKWLNNLQKKNFPYLIRRFQSFIASKRETWTYRKLLVLCNNLKYSKIHSLCNLLRKLEFLLSESLHEITWNISVLLLKQLA